ncbi:MAG: 50S ribosomal protein L1, partial [bacterium]|nr:50S ribosomal protein L1 [bacterium]
GRVKFESDKIKQNFQVLFDAIVKSRPTSAKGTYIKSIYLAPTMGPAVRVDPQKVAVAAGNR